MKPSPIKHFILRNANRIAIWSIGIAIVVYMVAIPAYQRAYKYFNPPTGSYLIEDLTFAENLRIRTMEGITGLWFFAFGAAVGSFLNVVAYRLPRGESVVFKRSSCPRCLTQIKGKDNVPILGWLLLRGRCRRCRLPVSARYPIVEAITASVFLLLFIVELISGGVNLPVRNPDFYHGVVYIILYPQWDLLFIYFFHCLTISCLLSVILIDVDRQRLPLTASALFCVLLFALASIRTDLLPMPWAHSRTLGFEIPRWMSGILNSAIGGLIGSVAGMIVSKLGLPKSVKHDENEAPSKPVSWAGHAVTAFAISGFSVGWQAVLGIGLFTMILQACTTLAGLRWRQFAFPLTAVILAAFIIHLLTWRWLSATLTPWWPTHVSNPWGTVMAATLLLVLCITNRFLLARRQQDDQSSNEAIIHD